MTGDRLLFDGGDRFVLCAICFTWVRLANRVRFRIYILSLYNHDVNIAIYTRYL